MAVRGDITINWAASPRTVTIAAPSTEITVRDLQDTLRSIEMSDEGILYPPLRSCTGNEDLGGGTRVGLTLKLLNAKLAFEARPGPSWVLCTISGGNVVAQDAGGAAMDVRQPTAYVSVDRASSSSGTVQELGAIQYASFGGGVTIDVVNGQAGTEFPIGTEETPVSSLADALTIATTRGFRVFHVKGNLTLGATDNVAGYTLVGQDTSSTLVTLVSGASTVATRMQQVTLTGTCGGRMDLTDCHLTNIVGLCASGGNANIVRCMLSDSIQMRSIADQAYNFVDCYGSAGLDAPVIDANGCSADINFSNYTGPIAFLGATNPAANISIDMNAGFVHLQSTVTQGEVSIRGIAKFVNDSVAQAGLSLDASGLVKPVDDQYFRRIYLSTSGAAGQEYPRGLKDYPVSNVVDALALAAKYNANELHFHSDMTLPSGADVSHLVLSAHSTFLHTLTLAPGCITQNTIFRELKVTGTLGGWATFENCLLINLSDLWGNVECVLLEGTIAFKDDPTAHVHIMDGRAHTQAPVVLSIKRARAHAVKCFGAFTLKDQTGTTEFYMHLHAGIVTIDPTCVSGSIRLAGNGTVTNNAGGATVLDQVACMADLRDEAFARWTLDPVADTLTLYKADGTTVMRTFALTRAGATEPPAYVGRTPA